MLLVLVIGLMAVPDARAGFETPFLYRPRKYSQEVERSLPAHVVRLDFQTSSGRQCVFYLPPATHPQGCPPRLWVLFGGNASLALDWLRWETTRAPDPGAGYLLIEYPGYGFCEGAPSASTILEASEGALRALARHTGADVARLVRNLGVLGHSLGCATALQFAVRHPVRKVILLAPFTSIREMALKYAGFWGILLVNNQFDNTARLTELAARRSPPDVLIVHGAADRVIPVEMGRKLAAKAAAIVRYREVPEGNHLNIAWKEKRAIIRMIRELARESKR